MGTSMYFIGDRAMFLQYPTVTFIFSVVSGLISLTEVNRVFFFINLWVSSKIVRWKAILLITSFCLPNTWSLCDL